MYNSHFTLKENPFSIAPDPDYLYMSKMHKEALAHLVFGLKDTGGFVLLTGEVGTGKTTISRCLLEKLTKDTSVAFIINPALTDKELLATICDELDIECKNKYSLKELTDSILDFLLKNYAKDKETLLIIDEAQHLKPNVLEQLRLLTNLESNKKKLLKIILIGQPELKELLESNNLRQLAQRITARYHLKPLEKQDISNYIFHRLNVAGCKRSLFSKGSIKSLQKISNGIPRLINLLCDRALLGAFSSNKSFVDTKCINIAAKEILGNSFEHKKKVSAYYLLIAILFSTFLFLYIKFEFPINNSFRFPDLLSFTKSKQTQELSKLYKEAKTSKIAHLVLLDLWQEEISFATKACLRPTKSNLYCYKAKGSFDDALKLNHPAVVKLKTKNNKNYYATLLTVTKKKANIVVADRMLEVSKSWLEDAWQGEFTILWRAPIGYKSSINSRSSTYLVQWLENSLSYILQEKPRVIYKYDQVLEDKIRKFQQLKNEKVDAIAGARTLIHINLELAKNEPRILN